MSGRWVSGVTRANGTFALAYVHLTNDDHLGSLFTITEEGK
jgi:hypothetical protein